MIALGYTRHAEMRMQQRGIRKNDIALILACATQIDDETWILRNRDVSRQIESRKREIRALERLANRKIVVREGCVITAYSSRRPDQKRTLRRGRRTGMAT